MVSQEQCFSYPSEPYAVRVKAQPAPTRILFFSQPARKQSAELLFCGAVCLGTPVYSSDKRANGFLEAISLSSPSCSSSPSLLGLSSLLLLPGGASKCATMSASPSCSCCRNRLLSECLSCRSAISCVSGCCCHIAVDHERNQVRHKSMVFGHKSKILCSFKTARTFLLACKQTFRKQARSRRGKCSPLSSLPECSRKACSHVIFAY